MILTDEAFEKQLINITNSEPSTVDLDFSFIEFTLARLTKLLEVLERNNCTRTLNLSVTYLREKVGYIESPLPNAQQDAEFCDQVAAHIAYNHNLEQLSLKSNQISNTAVIPILNAMQQNRSIRVLDLRDNDLSDEVIPHIKSMLTVNPIIELLNISYNKFSDEGMQQLQVLTSPYCTISCKRIPVSPLPPTRHLKQAKLDVGFDYIYIDRNKPINKQQAKLRINMRDRLKPLTGYEPDVCEKIYAAYLASEEIHPGILTLFDVFKVIEQVHARNPVFPSKQIIIDFAVFCLQQEDTENMLIEDILAAPNTNLRGQILYAIGNHYFAASGGILALIEDPQHVQHIDAKEMGVLKHYQQVYLLIAYIAFTKIEPICEDIQFLQYVICRTIITGEHRFGIERDQEEIAMYSDLGQEIFLPTFNAIKSMQDIEATAAELPSICQKIDKTKSQKNTANQRLSQSIM